MNNQQELYKKKYLKYKNKYIQLKGGYGSIKSIEATDLMKLCTKSKY
jgi:hypothetical protein